jgi:hypothetical protein
VLKKKFPAQKCARGEHTLLLLPGYHGITVDRRIGEKQIP